MASSAWLVAPDLGYINGLVMMLSYHQQCLYSGLGRVQDGRGSSGSCQVSNAVAN